MMQDKTKKTLSASHGIIPLILTLCLVTGQFGLLAILLYFFISVFAIALSVKVYGKYHIPIGILLTTYICILGFGYSTFKEKISETVYFLEGEAELLKKRLELQAQITIFPGILSTDKAQRLYIKAVDVKEVILSIPNSGEWHAVSLGHNLFRVDLSLDENSIEEGEITVKLFCDQKEYEKTLEIIKPIANPKWLRLSPDRKKVATVSENTDCLIIIDEEANHASIKLRNGPSDCQFIDDNTIIISYRYESFFEIYNLTQKTFKKINAPAFQHKVAFLNDLAAIAIHGDKPGILFYDLKQNTENFLELTSPPDFLCFGQSRNELVYSSRKDKYIGHLVYDEQWIENYFIDLPRPVVYMHHNDGKLYFSATARSDDFDLEEANHYISNIIMTLDLESGEVTKTVNTEMRDNFQNEPGKAVSGISPMGMHRDDFFVNVFCGSDELDLMVNGIQRRFYIDTPAPHDAVIMAKQMIIVSSPLSASLDIYSFENEDLYHENKISLNDFTEKQQDRVNGALTFYTTTHSSLSCQSCHLHGDSDYSNHNIGNDEFPSTLSVNDLHGTPPFLRNGDYPRLRDLHDVADEVYEGYPLEVDYDRRLTLEKWLQSKTLPVNPKYLKPNLEKEKKGLEIFISSNCVSCHQLPSFTSLRQYNGSRIFPDYYQEHDTVLDTPSLRGLWNTAPYLLDGRAKNLKEIFTKYNKDNKHGQTEHLTEDELDALINFLKSL